MILKNFYKGLAVTATNIKCKPTFIKPDGSSYNSYSSYSNYIAHFIKLEYLSDLSYVKFGDGDVPATIDDYKLSGNTITGLTGSAVASYTPDDDGITFSAVWTLTNGNADSVTIKEVGLTTYTGGYFIDRTVLDTPVTIPAGGVGQITYTIRLNYPT